MKRFFIAACLATFTTLASAQSQNFNLGQILDIQNSILKELSIGYVDSVKFDKLLITGINAMLSSLDPYTVYFPEEQEDDIEMMTTGIYGGIGSIIKKKKGEGVVIVGPYEGSPAIKSGLQPGDTIIAIDGKEVFDESSEQSSARMKGEPGTTVNFKIIKGRTGETVNINVLRERVHVSNIRYAGIIKDTIGYIEITGFTDKMSKELRTVITDLKKEGCVRFILDLRGNGGGLMEEAINMVSLFVPKGTMVVSSKGRMPEMNREYYTTEDPLDTHIPLMIMVISGRASSSESVAGALQDLDRAIIAGKRTFGKGLIQSIRPTTYNGSMKFTTGKYYTPSGRCVQAIDYSHRNEDGSVGAVPDSLIKEFKTKSGRIVKDGGGITPDIDVESRIYSRPAFSLVYNDILGDYATKYFIEHEKIAPVEKFVITDKEYEDFINYAQSCDFDYRSGIQAQIDELIKAAKYDGLYDEFKGEIDTLTKRLDMDKATVLRTKKDEIKPILEGEIAVKYYFNKASTIIALRNDNQLYDAINKAWGQK